MRNDWTIESLGRYLETTEGFEQSHEQPQNPPARKQMKREPQFQAMMSGRGGGRRQQQGPRGKPNKPARPPQHGQGGSLLPAPSVGNVRAIPAQGNPAADAAPVPTDTVGRSTAALAVNAPEN